MDTPLPSIESIRARLLGMSYAEVKRLALDTNTPFTTLWKIRVGTTTNPGIETVRLFLGRLPAETERA